MRPYKVLIFIACVMVCLAALCEVLPGRIAYGDTELRWPTLAEVLDLSEGTENSENSEYSENSENSERSDTIEVVAPVDTIVVADTLPVEQPKPVETPKEIETPKVAVASTTDSRVFLQTFYASLSEAGSKRIRVMHYGDSQIEEDRMTLQIRKALQAKYGGSGVGLMPLAQTIPSMSERQQLFMNGRLVHPSSGPRRYFVYGFKRDQRTDRKYGVMGQMSQMDDSLVPGSEQIMAVCTPKDNKARYTRWQVFADSTIQHTLSGDTVWLEGKGNVYGLSQESETGVIVDNIPMRGCLGTVFTKMDSTQLADFYREQNVRLIILQFGGNAIPYNQKPGTIHGIVRSLREQVRFIKSCAPQASILFIGPSDMRTQEDGEWRTYPMVPYMDKLLNKMALEEHIAYFSLFRWMGGSGSMKKWQEAGLAGSDGIHFYRSGARKAGNAVAEWMLEGIKS